VSIPIFVTESALPQSIGDLNFKNVEIYEDSRLGASVAYDMHDDVVADVYLYDFGINDIPNDVEAPEVLEYFQGAYHDLLRAADRGIYLNLQVRVSKYLHWPPTAVRPFCLWAAFSFSEEPSEAFPQGAQSVSHLALRTDRGHINKVRFTYPADPATEDQNFERFINFYTLWTAAVQDFGLLK
jgi:hypothetical protein